MEKKEVIRYRDLSTPLQILIVLNWIFFICIIGWYVGLTILGLIIILLGG